MTECAPYRELLPGYLDNELTAPRTAALEEHLSTCAACQAEVKQLLNDDRLLRATLTTPVAVSDQLTDRVWETIRARSRAETSHRAFRLLPQWGNRPRTGSLRFRLPVQPVAWVGSAAVAVALLLLVLLRPSSMAPTDMKVASLAGPAFWHPASSGTWKALEAGDILHAGDGLKTDAKGKITLTWKDGSQAVLGENGEGMALRMFPGMELKRGQVFAKVKKQQSKEAPFTVRTAQATAQVLGTEFVINAQPPRRTTVLTVLRGEVHLFNLKGSVTAGEWTQSQVIGDGAPSLPLIVSPLGPNSMWWLK